MDEKPLTEFEQMGQLCAEEWPTGLIFVDGDQTVILDEFERLEYLDLNEREQAHYMTSRQNGAAHSFAIMLASRKFPGIRTDSTFNIGRCNGNQFEKVPGLGNYYKGLAEAAGVDTTGKTYLSQLASFPGDPDAWVGGRGDVERVCEAKGYNCSGAVNYKSGEREAPPDIEIGEDIIQNEVDDIMDQDPGWKREDVEEKVRELRTGKVDPNPLLVKHDDGGVDLGIT